VWAGNQSGDSDDLAVNGVVLLAIVFGVVHCTAWNSYFLTVEEKWAWRLSSLIVTVIPLVVLMAYWTGPWTKEDKVDQFIDKYFVHWPCIVLYTLARIVLLLEAVFALRSLPSNAYETVNWLGLICGKEKS